MRQRRRTYNHEVEATPTCRLCRREAHLAPSGNPGIDDYSTLHVGTGIVCFSCAWRIMEQLSAVYSAPEITALERAKFRNTVGEGPKKPSAKRESGWVYYIRMGDAIKIGFATDVAKRMRAYPPTAELLAAHPGTQEVERQMHQRFGEHLTRGREWFAPASAIMQHIDDVTAQFGDASHLAYEYTQPKSQEQRVADMFKTRQHVDVARGAHSAVR